MTISPAVTSAFGKFGPLFFAAGLAWGAAQVVLAHKIDDTRFVLDSARTQGAFQAVDRKLDLLLKIVCWEKPAPYCTP